MLALGFRGHLAIIDPAIAMADNLVAARDECFRDIRVLLDGAGDGQNAERYVIFREDIEDTPDAAAASVLEHGFDQRVADPLPGIDADIVEHTFGNGVAVGEGRFPAAFVIQIEVDRDDRATRPFRIRQTLAITDEIARGDEILRLIGHGATFERRANFEGAKVTQAACLRFSVYGS